MVGPLYRDPRPAAQLLISSAAHQSLVHDHRLVKSRPPYRRNLASRAISRHERERERGGCSFPTFLRTLRRLNQPKCIAKRFFSCFYLSFESPSSFSPSIDVYDFALFLSFLRFFSLLFLRIAYLFIHIYIRFKALIFLWAVYLWRSR